MLVGWRVEGMLHNHLRLREAFFHLPFPDFDVLEQIPFFMDLWNALLSRLDRIREDRLEIELRFNQL